MRNLACSQPSLHHICDNVGFGYLLVSAFRVKYFRKKSPSRIACLSGFKCNHDCNLEGFWSSEVSRKVYIKLSSQKLELKAEEVPYDSMDTCLPQRASEARSREREGDRRDTASRDMTINSGLMEWLSP